MRLLAAVVLLMVVVAKLLAVVAPADQVATAAGVPVMLAPVTRPVTVSLALPTRVLGSAAPPAPIVPARTSLAILRFKWDIWIEYRHWIWSAYLRFRFSIF